MLAGQITGRCISLADIRNVVGNLQYGDYGMATVSAIGLAPGGGGDAKTGGKDAKFALKMSIMSRKLRKDLDSLQKDSPPEGWRKVR